MEALIKNVKKNKIFIFVILLELSFANQNFDSEVSQYDFGITKQKYTKNPDGVIMISVNLWGNIVSPGRHVVPEGSDLITILSTVGGPKDGANLSKIKIIRDSENLSKIFIIDLNKFIFSGDKSKLVKIEPNDTIIIPETTFSQINKRLGSVNTIFSLFVLYLTIIRNL